MKEFDHPNVMRLIGEGGACSLGATQSTDHSILYGERSNFQAPHPLSFRISQLPFFAPSTWNVTSDLFPEIAEVPRRAPETSLGKGFSEVGVPTTHLPNNVEIRFEGVGKGKAEFVWERGWVPLFCIARMTDLALGGGGLRCLFPGF